MDFQDSNQLVSAYDGFNISLIFLRRLWLSLEPKVSSFSEDVYSAHTLFFGTICFETECYQEWAFALFHLKPEGDFSDFLKELFHLRKTDKAIGRLFGPFRKRASFISTRSTKW